MKTKKNLILIILVFIFSVLAFSAVSIGSLNAQGLWELQEKSGMGTESKSIGELFERNNGPTDIRKTVANIIKVFLTLLGLFFTVLIIFGGFRWMNSRGNDDEVKKAKDQIKHAIIGMVIIIAAYAITEFVIRMTKDAITGEIRF
jgi:amino acid transporter